MSAGTATERLRRAVQDASGWELTGPRGDLFEGTLARAAGAARVPPEEYAERVLRSGRAALDAFAADAAVGETYFFRDPVQWDLVESHIIPAVLARRGPGERTLFRAWSAGCSTGEEPYTLAMLLADRGLLERVRLLATDISPTAVRRARAAEYTQWSLRGGMDPRARRWLHEDAGRLRVDERVAAAVQFSPLNLIDGAYPDASRGLAEMDLILCRNVLLYLRADVVAAVAERLFATVAPGGWLLTGASDPPLRRHAPWVVHAGAFGVAYQRPDPRASTPANAPPEHGVPARAPAAARAGAMRSARRDPRASQGVPGIHQAPPDACPGCRQLVDSGRFGEALSLVDASLRRQPLAPELHLLRAIVMADLGHLREAETACRRAIFLARSEPFLHFFLATVLSRMREVPGAAAALRAAVRLAERLAPDEEIPWSEGMTAAELAGAARWQLERLEAGVPAAP